MEYQAELELILPSPAIRAVGHQLWGVIHGDQQFQDGAVVQSSKVVSVHATGDDIFIVTEDKTYKYRKFIDDTVRQVGKG